ncbi:hypothetical protein AVM72_00415 [Piscirickettsia salmonis]|nr:hypothetical protein AVM72_00415 [Piscirickettsia salmonis]APS64635.1 hypothetical protein AVI54_13100 [Piscirickettsia salmonis]APS77642.1 hypothetical protein AVM74_13115 [Piscirickettsia salmonis]APS78705.1 hypothetical protein AVM73_00415 [Piscirickettsia salmonis]
MSMALQDLKNSIKELLLNIKRHENSKIFSRDKAERNVNQAVDKAASIASKLTAKVANTKLGARVLTKLNVNPEPVPDPSPSMDPVDNLEQVDSRSRAEILNGLLLQVNDLQLGRECLNLLVNGLQKKEAFWGKGNKAGYFHVPGHEGLKEELTECVAACKEQMLEDIRSSIENKAKSGGFEFGLGGSNYTLEMGNQSFGIPKRAYKICEIIDNSDLSAEEKFTKIKEIKVAALTYQPSFPWFRRLTGIGDTKESTNRFFANLDCAEDCYDGKSTAPAGP